MLNEEFFNVLGQKIFSQKQLHLHRKKVECTISHHSFIQQDISKKSGHCSCKEQPLSILYCTYYKVQTLTRAEIWSASGTTTAGTRASPKPGNSSQKVCK